MIAKTGGVEEVEGEGSAVVLLPPNVCINRMLLAVNLFLRENRANDDFSKYLKPLRQSIFLNFEAVSEAVRLLDGSPSLTTPPLVMHILGD